MAASIPGNYPLVTENANLPQVPPVESAPVPPSAPGIEQPVIHSQPTVIGTAPITAGSADVALPDWQQVGSITQIEAGPAVVNLTITVEKAAAGTVYVGYSLGSGTVSQIEEVNVEAATSETLNITLGTYLPQTINFYISSDDEEEPTTWSGGTIEVVRDPTVSAFPEFTPLIPPPPMSDPEGVPVFPPVPPDTAPVDVPLGPLVGPAVAPAPVPPSVAGYVQPRFFGTGNSATFPPAGSLDPENPESDALFPQFTTTFPKPPVVVNAVQNTDTPIWVAPPQPPPMTITTQNVTFVT